MSGNLLICPSNLLTPCPKIAENDTAWFGKIGGIAPGDDALPLLSTTNKPYRKLILANAISIFDFRIYLFARQAALLAQMGRITDVAKRGAYFISTFARTLRENEVRHLLEFRVSLFPDLSFSNSFGTDNLRAQFRRILDLLCVSEYRRRMPTLPRNLIKGLVDHRQLCGREGRVT